MLTGTSLSVHVSLVSGVTHGILEYGMPACEVLLGSFILNWFIEGGERVRENKRYEDI